TWDLVAITIAKVALEEILNATTDWINSGFEGNPAYATNPRQFFTNIADNIAGEFIAGSDLAFLCSPFQVQIRLALQRYHTQRRQFQCSLTKVVGNIEAFYDDFSQGGWDGWFSMTQNDANNPYGAYLEAKIELDSRVANALGIQREQLSWNSGFLSWSECVAEDSETGECRERGPTKTPGVVIESQLEGVLGSGVRQLELADELDELVSALFGQLLKQVVFGAQGLFSENSGPPPPLLALGISKSGNGSGTITSSLGDINCGTTCFALYDRGTSVTLTATPSADSIFTGWPGACFGTGTCVVGMTADKNITATFDLRNTLNIFKSGTGTGTVTSAPAGINCGSSCSVDYSYGTSVTLTATPSADSIFTGWSGACSVIQNRIESCTASMTTTINVEAAFAEISDNENNQ
ncbi:MAG: hypothetical protein WD897_00695, partial [Parcubacteria group bacterium]